MTKENNSVYRLDWNTLKRDWPLWLVMLGLLAAAVIIYPHLPSKVPGHWNINGQVDTYYSRSFGAFFAPLLALGLYLMMLFIPLIDPRRDNYPRFTGAYAFIRWSMVLFTGIMYLTTIVVALGYQLDVAMVVKAACAVLLIIVGNFMGQFRHNYFVGIRTPWTLASEEVWQRTHRIGARIYVLCGLICLLMSPFLAVWSTIIFFAAIMVMVLFPFVYSYLLFNKLKTQ